MPARLWMVPSEFVAMTTVLGPKELRMQRRRFLTALPAVALTWVTPAALAAAPASRSIAEIQQGWQKLLAPGAEVAISTEPINKTEAEWKRLLTPTQFNVLRQ